MIISITPQRTPFWRGDSGPFASGSNPGSAPPFRTNCDTIASGKPQREQKRISSETCS